MAEIILDGEGEEIRGHRELEGTILKSRTTSKARA